MMSRVAITGLGAVSAFGWTTSDLWAGLALGRSTVAVAGDFPVAGQRTQIASVVSSPPVEAEQSANRFSESSKRFWKRLSRADQFAVTAAIEAALQAGLGVGTERSGVFFGGSTAAMWEAEEFYARLTGASEGPAGVACLASHPLNGPGDAVARLLQVDGPVETVSSACASGTLALGAALDALRSGEVDIAYVGGADSLCRLTYSGFNSLRAVDSEPCRPFRQDRAGLSLGEGGAVLVLEREESASHRGATPLGYLLGAGASCDAHHMTAPHPEGKGAVQAIRSALADSDLGPESVGFINAHGTGTPHNDGSEAKAFAEVFGERIGSVPVTSTKGLIGHLLGSAGSIEAVATILCLGNQLVHITPGEGLVDEEGGIDLVLSEPRPLAAESLVALSTNLAFGGANSAALFSGPDKPTQAGGGA